MPTCVAMVILYIVVVVVPPAAGVEIVMPAVGAARRSRRASVTDYDVVAVAPTASPTPVKVDAVHGRVRLVLWEQALQHVGPESSGDGTDAAKRSWSAVEE